MFLIVGDNIVFRSLSRSCEPSISRTTFAWNSTAECFLWLQENEQTLDSVARCIRRTGQASIVTIVSTSFHSSKLVRRSLIRGVLHWDVPSSIPLSFLIPNKYRFSFMTKFWKQGQNVINYSPVWSICVPQIE
jgi:hypothetical protein